MCVCHKICSVGASLWGADSPHQSGYPWGWSSAIQTENDKRLKFSLSGRRKHLLEGETSKNLTCVLVHSGTLFLIPAASGQNGKGKDCNQPEVEVLNIFLFSLVLQSYLISQYVFPKAKLLKILIKLWVLTSS